MPATRTCYGQEARLGRAYVLSERDVKVAISEAFLDISCDGRRGKKIDRRHKIYWAYRISSPVWRRTSIGPYHKAGGVGDEEECSGSVRVFGWDFVSKNAGEEREGLGWGVKDGVEKGGTNPPTFCLKTRATIADYPISRDNEVARGVGEDGPPFIQRLVAVDPLAAAVAG
jgi:hypothetical protein